MSRALLMIHGVGCGGDVWDTMRPIFEGAGFECEAPTIFPNLRTLEDPPERLGTRKLSDYVEEMSDQAKAMMTNGKRPAVIGHSMGGLIAQTLAERGLVSAAIFLTPASPAGCTVTDLRVVRTFWSVVSLGEKKLPGRAVKVGRRGFSWGVLNAVPRPRHAGIYKAARYDSGQVYIDLLKPPTVEAGRVRVPTLTIGAGKDRATVVKAVRKLAAKYGAAAYPGDYLEYPDNAHWIVDEPGTDIVTADLVTWLNRKMPA